MKTPKPITRTTIDVLSELNKSPDAWSRIGVDNALLSSRTGTEEEQAEAEMMALVGTAELIGDDDFVGEKTTIIGLGRTASQATLELMAVEGRYDTVTSLTEEQTNREQLAICIKTGRGKGIERYYFPLDDATLAHFEVDMVEEDGPHYVTQLRKSCRQMGGYLRSEEFRKLDPDAKQEQAEQILEGINSVLRTYADGSVIQVESSRYSQHTSKPGQYSVEEKNQPLRTLAGDAAKFILPVGSTEPVLELVDSQAQVKYWIQPKYITEILSFNGESDMQTVDLFGQWFDQEYQGVAYSLEVDLGYARKAIQDEEEWEQVYGEAIEELEAELPSGDLLDAVYLTGFVFTNDGNDNYQLTFCDSDMIMIDGPEFIEVDGEFKAVLSATIWDSTTKEEGTVCVVPSQDYLMRFESPMGEESKIYTIVSAMHRDADGARAIISTPDFYQLPLDEQQEVLEIYAESVSDHLATLDEFFEDYRVDFRVTEYRCLPGDILGLGWDNPLVNHEKVVGGATLSVVADAFSVHNPDTDDPTRVEAFKGSEEFVMSNGEPMVVLESTVTDMYYLVRVRDIIHCAPIFETGEQ